MTATLNRRRATGRVPVTLAERLKPGEVLLLTALLAAEKDKNEWFTFSTARCRALIGMAVSTQTWNLRGLERRGLISRRRGQWHGYGIREIRIHHETID